MALRRSSFPTTTPTTTATPSRWGGCSPSTAPSSPSPTSVTRTGSRWSSSRPRSCWPGAQPRSERPTCPSHVVVNPATSEGLTELAESEEGRHHHLRLRIPHCGRHSQAGDLRPQTPARGTVGDRRRPGRPPHEPGGQRRHGRRDRRGRSETRGRRRTASPRRLARMSSSIGCGPVDLLVVGSRPEAPEGRVDAQRLERLRGRGGHLPGDRDPARDRDQLRGGSGPSLPLRDQDDGRDRGVAAVDPTLRGRPLDLAGVPPGRHLRQRREGAVERVDLDLDRGRRRAPLARALRPRRARRG